MIQKIKRPLSILLSIMMVVSLFTIVPITASAAEETITINSGTDKLSNHGIQNLHYGNHSDFNGNGLPWGTFVAPTGKVFTKIVTNGTDDAMNWTGSAERVDHDGMMGEWYIDWETDEDGFRPFTISFTLADAPAPELPDVIKDCTYQKTNSKVFANVPFKPDGASDYSSLTDGAIDVVITNSKSVMLGDVKEYSYKFYDQTGTEIAATLAGSQDYPGSEEDGLSADETLYVKVFNLNIPENLYIVATAPTEPTTEPATEEPPTDVPVTEPTTEPATEPAAEPIFVKATSADEFTADNMGSCTYEEAKAWAEANLDTLKAELAAVGGSYTWLWIAYASTDTQGDYRIFSMDNDGALSTDPDLVEDIDTLQVYYGNDGDLVYYVKKAKETQTVTWDNKSLQKTSGGKSSGGVTLTTQQGQTRVNDCFYSERGSATFTAPEGSVFTKIELKNAEYVNFLNFPGATVAQSGGYWDDTIPEDPEWVPYYTVTWTGESSEVTFSGAVYQIQSIVFTLALTAADDVKALINALPTTVTVDNKEQVEAARAAYNALSDDEKAKIDADTLKKLTDAEDVIAAAEVTKKITDLPETITDENRTDVEAARSAYDALTDAQKALVTADTLKTLTDAEDVIAAAEVTKQINDLPEEIKLSDKTDVEAARAAYDALTDAQKALVTADTLKTLTDAEDVIAAAEVTKQINDLPEEIKLSDKTDVEAARAAYDALTDDQKALVDAATLKVLTDAEDAIAAAEVTKKIKDIPDNVTIEDKDDVHAARAAFNALSYAQKGLVDANDLVKLNKAERDITDLTTAKDVTDAIDALPSNVTAGDKENIEAARAAYNALTDKQKALVSADTLAKLTEAEGKLADEIADKEEADKVTGQINDLPVNVNLKDKETVEAVRAAYDALTDNQKTYVTKEAKNKLTAAEKRIADQKAASIVIFKINTLPSEITLDSKTQIEATRAAYNALTADQKKWVDAVYVKKLTDAEDALAKIVADQQAANDVTTLINALPETITLTDKTNVEAARAAYNDLTDDQKAYVSADTLKKLTDAEAALAVVVADKQAADDVATLINALPAKANVTLDDQANIEAARSAYSALSYNQKGYIDTTTYAKLTGAEAGLAAVKADKKAADDVAALINALPTEVTLNDQTDIEAARSAYGALTDTQKAFIDEPTLKKLTDAEAALSLLIDDKTAADNVINKINALPAKADVTLDDQTNIEAARAAFNALSVAQKGYVDAETQTKLTDAEAGLAAVKADKKAADDVAALIEALPAKADVTLNDKDNIEAARAAYDALTDKQKAFVDAETLTKLTDAEAGLAAVNADKKAADDVKALIDALPTNVVTTDKDNIEAARAAYNALTDSQKAFVDADTLTKLTDAEAALAQAFIDKGAADGVTDLINALPTENLSIDNRDQIKQAREAYDALTDAQKYYVTEETLKKLTDVEDAFAPIEKLYNDQKAALTVEYMIDDLPDTITAADKKDVEAARAAYNDLTDDQKKWVEKPFLDKLVAAEDALAAADVTAMINALPENITLDDKDDVEAARAAFNGLSFDQKGYITPATQTKLSSAEAVIAKLVADKNAADAVTKKITDLPETITLNDKNDVEAARSAYNALTDDQKALITGDTLTKLTDAEAALATVLADKEAADDVISKINALPAKDDVTLDDETDITAARSAFNGLSVAQKGYVDAATQTKLTDAEAGLAAVKADKKAADDVKAMIDALPETITLNDKTDVEAARKAYDDLTDKQKAFVDDDTLAKLTDAEEDIEVEKVKEMINNLPAEVTLDNVNDVVAASEAYENLTDAQRAKIDANAVKKLVTAANAAVKLLADYKEAEKVANQINALPENISVVNKDAVVAAREAYNALTDDQKAMIDEATYNKLTDAEAAMDDPYYLIGDVDGNGTVNINDATAIQKYLAGLLELDETQIKCADTNADGNVTIGDATMIQKYISGLVDHLG